MLWPYNNITAFWVILLFFFNIYIYIYTHMVGLLKVSNLDSITEVGEDKWTWYFLYEAPLRTDGAASGEICGSTWRLQSVGIETLIL